MALDLGTLGVRVEAQVGDTINRLNSVTDALEKVDEKAAGVNNSVSQLDIKNAFDEATTAAKNFKDAMPTKLPSLGDPTSEAKAGTDELLAKLAQFDPTGAITKVTQLATTAKNGIGTITALVGASGGAMAAGGAIAAGVVALWKAAEQAVADTNERLEEYQELVSKQAQSADDTATNAVIWGISTQLTQVLELGQDLFDVDTGAWTRYMNVLRAKTNDAVNGDKGAVEAFKNLGISVGDLTREDGSLKSMDDILALVTGKIQENYAATNDLKKADDLLGEEITSKLSPVLTKTKEEWDNLKGAIEETKAVMDPKQLELLTNVSDAQAWLAIMQEGLANTKALMVAVDETKRLEAMASKNQLMADVLTGKGLDSEAFNAAVAKYAEAYYGEAKSTRNMSDTEQYVETLWSRNTSKVLASAAWDAIGDGVADTNDLLLAIGYTIEAFKDDVMLNWYDLMNYLGFMDINLKSAFEEQSEHWGEDYEINLQQYLDKYGVSIEQLTEYELQQIAQIPYDAVSGFINSNAVDKIIEGAVGRFNTDDVNVVAKNLMASYGLTFSQLTIEGQELWNSYVRSTGSNNSSAFNGNFDEWRDAFTSVNWNTYAKQQDEAVSKADKAASNFGYAVDRFAVAVSNMNTGGTDVNDGNDYDNLIP